MEDEIAIYFSKEDFDKIITYMDEQNSDTIQEAVMDAIKWGKYYHDYVED